jgi:hypothetical protein
LQTATLLLPNALRWSAHTGETDPILGWYSARFGERVPATTLLGEGVLAVAPGANLELCTSLQFRTPASTNGAVTTTSRLHPATPLIWTEN